MTVHTPSRKSDVVPRFEVAAHIPPQSDHPEYAEELGNVLVLNPLHYQAVDDDLFTLDTDYRIRVSPSFDPSHPLLHKTIIECCDEQIEISPGRRRLRRIYHGA